MKTVLISGAVPVPPELRELIARGSTSLEERSIVEGAAETAGDADRVVFWSAAEDAELSSLARDYARRQRAERSDRLVFVAADAAVLSGAGPLPPNDCYVWPRDEDRLKIAFLTAG